MTGSPRRSVNWGTTADIRLGGIYALTKTGEEAHDYADPSLRVLSGADMVGANLTGANLTRANLSGAELSGLAPSVEDRRPGPGANLSRALLSGTDLSGAKLRRGQLTPLQLRAAKNTDQIAWIS